MTPRIVAVRISRRAVAAARLAGDALEFRDGRFLRSDRARAGPALVRYLKLVIGQTAPSRILIDCPRVEGSATQGLLALAQGACAAAGVPTSVVSTPELLQAFGESPLGSRTELRLVVAPLFPELDAFTGKVRPYLLEAAALALLAESRAALGDLPA